MSDSFSSVMFLDVFLVRLKDATIQDAIVILCKCNKVSKVWQATVLRVAARRIAACLVCNAFKSSTVCLRPIFGICTHQFAYNNQNPRCIFCRTQCSLNDNNWCLYNPCYDENVSHRMLLRLYRAYIGHERCDREQGMIYNSRIHMPLHYTPTFTFLRPILRQ